MSKEDESEKDEFIELLSSISSQTSYDILNVLTQFTEGLTLTETSNKIDKNTSTVRDNLSRLKDNNLVYKKEKRFYLSNFGSFILRYIRHLEIFNKTRQVFGQIPAELIPSKFIQELVPHISDIEIKSDQWEFITISTGIMDKIRADLKSEPGELRVIGWESLTKAMEIMTNLLMKGIEVSYPEFLQRTTFELISNMKMVEDISKNKEIQPVAKLIKDKIHICENISTFEFVLFRYKQTIQFFLYEGGTLGMGYHFVLEDNPEAVKFFDNVFNYYLDQSVPLAHLL